MVDILNLALPYRRDFHRLCCGKAKSLPAVTFTSVMWLLQTGSLIFPVTASPARPPQPRACDRRYRGSSTSERQGIRTIRDDTIDFWINIRA
jgi:hypothetical protein